MVAQELWHIINIYKWVQNVKCIHIKFLVYFCEILCIKFKLWTLFMSCWHYLPHVAVGGGSSLDVTLGLAPADNGLVTRLSPRLPRLPGQEGAHDEAGHRPPPHCCVWLLLCYASNITDISSHQNTIIHFLQKLWPVGIIMLAQPLTVLCTAWINVKIWQKNKTTSILFTYTEICNTHTVVEMGSGLQLSLAWLLCSLPRVFWSEPESETGARARAGAGRGTGNWFIQSAPPTLDPNHRQSSQMSVSKGRGFKIKFLFGVLFS